MVAEFGGSGWRSLLRASLKGQWLDRVWSSRELCGSPTCCHTSLAQYSRPSLSIWETANSLTTITPPSLLFSLLGHRSALPSLLALRGSKTGTLSASGPQASNAPHRERRPLPTRVNIEVSKSGHPLLSPIPRPSMTHHSHHDSLPQASPLAS